ncbi:MAG: modification methylase, partial [Clostridia bacterium]|nr:modification methylase [Clostridia bacterium]
MADNKGLHNANRAKKDEFYTQLTDIEKELKHYKEHFKDKVVFCNCDDPEYSNFWKYFQNNFYFLGLKKLVSTHYNTDGTPSYKMEIVRTDNGNQMGIPNYVKTSLHGNGDFRSDECIEILKQADIVVTNPPFSLFREYVAQLIEYDKKFIIIGNQNAITYKEFFPLIKDNKVWFGNSIHSGDREFRVPDDYPLNAASYRVDDKGNKYLRIKGVRWFTNLDYKERHEDLILFRNYNEQDYPKFENYDAINVDKTVDIPCDYFEKIGVPIT